MVNLTADQIADICRDYRHAKYPRRQLRILADLYGCTVADIAQVVDRSLGPRRQASYVWTSAAVERLIDCNGRYTSDEVARSLGITDGQVRSKASRLRAQGYDVRFAPRRRGGDAG